MKKAETGVGFSFPGDDEVIAMVRDEYMEDGLIDIDDDAVISRGDEPGAYVMAWVWVDFRSNVDDEQEAIDTATSEDILAEQVRAARVPRQAQPYGSRAWISKYEKELPADAVLVKAKSKARGATKKKKKATNKKSPAADKKKSASKKA